jgi:hypothetical protein
LKKLIDVKQNEFEGLSSFSKLKKIRNQYMLLQPTACKEFKVTDAGNEVVKKKYTLDLQWRWKNLNYYCTKLILAQNYIIVVTPNILYICNFEREFKVIPVNTLGLISLHRGYIKDYQDLSSLGLEFGPNFRHAFDFKGDKRSDLVFTFSNGDIYSLKIDQTEQLNVNFKQMNFDNKHRTIPSGIGIIRVASEIYICISSRYSDLILYKLNIDKNESVKRQKISEDEHEFSWIHDLIKSTPVIEEVSKEENKEE